MERNRETRRRLEGWVHYGFSRVDTLYQRSSGVADSMEVAMEASTAEGMLDQFPGRVDIHTLVGWGVSDALECLPSTLNRGSCLPRSEFREGCLGEETWIFVGSVSG